MKGGHVPGERVVDLLITPDGETVFEGERIETRHTHGTGCTLASACADGPRPGPAARAAAVARAWDYVHEAMLRAPGFGARPRPPRPRLAAARPGVSADLEARLEEIVRDSASRSCRCWSGPATWTCPTG